MIGEQITVTTSPTLLVDARTTSHVNYPESLILYVPVGGGDGIHWRVDGHHRRIRVSGRRGTSRRHR